MNRIIKLNNNLNHRLAKNTDFMSRLLFKKEGDLPSKIDCINILLQYMAIYKAIELRLNDVINENTLYLSIFNKEPWTDSSQHLKNDIREMRSLLSDDEKTCLITNDKLFPAVQKMVEQIAVADPVTLFALLSVRCLGDVIEGERLSQHYQRVFDKHNLKGEFFNGISNQTSYLNQFIDQALLIPGDEEQFNAAVDNFFQLHIDLYNEMEADRILPETNKIVTQPINYVSGCRFALFALTTIGVTAAAMGTAYCNMTSPLK